MQETVVNFKQTKNKKVTLIFTGYFLAKISHNYYFIFFLVQIMALLVTTVRHSETNKTIQYKPQHVSYSYKLVQFPTGLQLCGQWEFVVLNRGEFFQK